MAACLLGVTFTCAGRLDPVDGAGGATQRQPRARGQGEAASAGCCQQCCCTRKRARRRSTWPGLCEKQQREIIASRIGMLSSPSTDNSQAAYIPILPVGRLESSARAATRLLPVPTAGPCAVTCADQWRCVHALRLQDAPTSSDVAPPAASRTGLCFTFKSSRRRDTAKACCIYW